MSPHGFEQSARADQVRSNPDMDVRVDLEAREFLKGRQERGDSMLAQSAGPLDHSKKKPSTSPLRGSHSRSSFTTRAFSCTS